MRIILHKNESDSNVLNKIIRAGNAFELNGELKDSTDVLYPTLTIEMNEYPKYNYVEIPDFERFYFIENIKVVRNRIYELSLSVDVLMSHKSFILRQNAFINRNEFEFDDLIRDEMVPSKSDIEIKAYNYSRLFSKLSDTVNYYWSFDYYNYVISVLAIRGVGVTGQIGTFYNGNILNSNFLYFFNSTYPVYNFWNNMCNQQFLSSLVNLYQNNADFISGTYITPLDMVGYVKAASVHDGKIGGYQPLTMGNAEISVPGIGEDNCTSLYPEGRSIRMFAELEEDITFDHFTKLNPYSTYYLYIPFSGIHEINSNVLLKGTKIIIDFDPTNGSFMCNLADVFPFEKTVPFIHDYVEPNLVSFSGNFYRQSIISSTNKDEIYRNMTMSAITSAISLMVSTNKYNKVYNQASSMRTPKRGKISAKAQRMIEGAKTTFQNETMLNAGGFISDVISQTPSADFRGGSEDINAFKYVDYPILFKCTPKYFYPSDYEHLFGKPIEQYFSLINLRGFTQVGRILFTNIPANLMNEELDEIENILLTGIYL